MNFKEIRSYEISPKLIDLLTGKGKYSSRSQKERRKLFNRWRNIYDVRFLDLKGVDLSYCDLSEFDFRWVNFEGANLNSANFRRSDIRQADLEKATLEGTNLRGAKINRYGIKSLSSKGAKIGFMNFLREIFLGNCERQALIDYWFANRNIY